jgi:hypothetical protein
VPGGNVRGLGRWMALRRWQPRAGWRKVSAFVGVAREKARLLSAAGVCGAPGDCAGDSTRGASQAFWRWFAGVVPSGCSERMRAHFF